MVLALLPEGTSLSQLAELGKVMEVDSPFVAATSTTPASDPISVLNEELQQLCLDMSRLEKLVDKFSHSQFSSCSNRPFSHHSTPPPPTQSNSVLCWYHHKFGDKAQRCYSVCAWSGNH